MSGFSDYLELELLDHVFKVGAYTAATNLYVALSKSTIVDADTGPSITGELSGDAYERKICNTWDAASGGSLDNTGAITFTASSGAWGVITHFAICDAITAGNMLAWAALTSTKNVGSGDTVEFAAGALKCSLT